MITSSDGLIPDLHELVPDTLGHQTDGIGCKHKDDTVHLMVQRRMLSVPLLIGQNSAS